MPLLLIYHPPSTFADQAEKQELVDRLTFVYRALPRHYVDILFIPVQATSYFNGGVCRPSAHDAKYDPQPKPEVPHIRIAISHIARTFITASIRDDFLKALDEALKPSIADKGWDWEYSVEETRRDLWKINGLVPPMPDTKAEKEWIETNVPKPFRLEDGGLTEVQPMGFSAQI
ncbi:hypothetical protein ACHAO1_011243 [Botrytis cinerea]